MCSSDLQLSVAVQVSVTVPPQAVVAVEKVDGLEVPLIKHPPVNPLENEIVLASGNAPQATVTAAGAVIVGKAAGLMVIVLETGAKARPQLSVAVQVSVTVPPQAVVAVEKVDGLEVPLIAHVPVNPLENEIVLAAGNAPQATVTAAGAVIVGKAAGLMVIVLDFVITLHSLSVKVHDSVTLPPQAPFGDWELNVEITDPLMRHGPVPLLL